MVKPEGQYVIVVAPDQRAHYKSVKLGRDFGHASEVLEGLSATETILTEPSNQIKEGDKLKTVLKTETKPEMKK